MTVRLDGSSYLRLAAKIAGSYPFTVVVWAGIRSGGGVNEVFWSQSQSGGADRYAYQRASASGNVTAGTGWVGGTGGSSTNKAPSALNSTLRVAMAVFKTSGSPYCENYYGDNTPSQDTNAITDQITNHDQFVLGAYDLGGFIHHLNGDLAELHIYNAALTASDWTTLNAMTGTIDGPTQGPESIAGWVDGFALTGNSDLTSIGGTRTLTLTGSFSGSAAQAHPFTATGRSGGSSSVPLKLQLLMGA